MPNQWFLFTYTLPQIRYRFIKQPGKQGRTNPCPSTDMCPYSDVTKPSNSAGVIWPCCGDWAGAVSFWQWHCLQRYVCLSKTADIWSFFLMSTQQTDMQAQISVSVIVRLGHPPDRLALHRQWPGETKGLRRLPVFFLAIS